MSDKDAREEARKRFEIFAAKYWEGRVPGPVPIFAKTIDGLYIHERVRTGSEIWQAAESATMEQVRTDPSSRLFGNTLEEVQRALLLAAESQRTQTPSTPVPTFESWISEDGVRIFPKLSAGTQAPSTFNLQNAAQKEAEAILEDTKKHSPPVPYPCWPGLVSIEAAICKVAREYAASLAGTQAPSGTRTKLLKIAAKVARREYVPSLENCRTISDARAEVRRMDDLHAQLAWELKTVLDALAGTQAQAATKTDI